jgi:hypothetical protein
MSRQSSFLAGNLAAAVLMAWAAGVSAQTTGGPMKLPPLPPATQDSAATNTQPAPPQADTEQQPSAAEQASPAQQAAAPAAYSASTLPPLPLDHDGIREVQSQLIALGFDPGAADGETGPATMAAVEKYNESRGGNGAVPVDGRLLARLQQDTGPRLTPEQVAARARPRYQAQPPANPVAGMMQQFERLLNR